MALEGSELDGTVEADEGEGQSQEEVHHVARFGAGRIDAGQNLGLELLLRGALWTAEWEGWDHRRGSTGSGTKGVGRGSWKRRARMAWEGLAHYWRGSGTNGVGDGERGLL